LNPTIVGDTAPGVRDAGMVAPCNGSGATSAAIALTFSPASRRAVIASSSSRVGTTGTTGQPGVRTGGFLLLPRPLTYVVATTTFHGPDEDIAG
jgi:hypothetical protein